MFHKIEYGEKIYNILRNKKHNKVYFIDGSTKAEYRDLYKEKINEKNYTVELSFKLDNGVTITFNEDDKVELKTGEIKLAKEIEENDEISDKYLK